MTDPCCDRRQLLRVGLGGWLGLLLAGRARAQAEGATEAAPPAVTAADACVVLWMSGGMSQTDTFDPKPGTASAGPLKAIRTAQKDVLLSELLPLTAEHMRHVSLIRSMATREGAHDRATYLVHTGWAPSGTVRHPDLGALVSQALARPDAELPPYVCIGGQGTGPGLLGVPFAPFTVADPTRPVQDLAYPQGVDAARFARRRRLLEAVERQFRRDHPGDETDGHRAVFVKADRLMHSREVRAFDLAQEPARTRAAYGEGAFGQGCLMARRLVEAGVKAVEVQLGGWDTHRDNFTGHRRLAAVLDRGLAALLGDLRERDLLRRTLVLVATEFGRTPRINADDGRDHHAVGWSVALAGGPVRGGRVIGATSADGQTVVERPVAAADLLATLAHALGVDRARVNTTPEGRPIQVVDPAGRVVRELFTV
ncbi:MAG: DUF1501 domain-containing protein [Planctomycetes bacterium]|nr:DUF1501 domain-containing protein [Planctomycetota bacterium]